MCEHNPAPVNCEVINGTRVIELSVHHRMRWVPVVLALSLVTLVSAASTAKENEPEKIALLIQEGADGPPAIAEGGKPNEVANEVPERDSAKLEAAQPTTAETVQKEKAEATADKEKENLHKKEEKVDKKDEKVDKKEEIVDKKEIADKKEDEKRNEEPKEEEVKQEDKVSYSGAQVIRVVLKTKDQKKFIKNSESIGEIETWMGNGTAVDVLVRNLDFFKQLEEKQLNYEVIISDLQQAIDDENPQLSEEEVNELVGRKGHRLTWQMYHRMNDIHGYLDYLSATYPQQVTVSTIGTSVEGRPLKLVKVASGVPNSPAIWVDAGIHAREWITPASLTYVISQMVEGGDGTKGVDWYFLPLVNPDGYEYSHTRERLWRKNRASAEKGACAGTDLNRNFAYKWGGQGASRQPCRETYAGTGPFSEPETSAINNFVTRHNSQIKAYVSLHSYGQYILYPWGYDRKVPPDYDELARVGRLMASAIRKTGGQSYTVGSAANTLYPASGGSDDWAKGTAKIKYAYTIELRDTGRHGFVLPAQHIVYAAKDAYAALDVLAKEIAR